MSDTRTAPVGRRERSKRVRREALLAAAARALAAQGPGATVDAIAREAGVAKVVLYRYFASRDAIVEAVLESVTTAIEARMAEPWTGYGSGMRHLLAVARAQPEAFRLLLGGGPVAAPFVARCRAGLVARVKALDPDRADRPERFDAMAAEAVATLALDAAARWVAEGRRDEDEAFLRWYAAATRALDGAWRGEGERG